MTNKLYISAQAGYTPLVTATQYGKLDVVNELLDNGANVNALTNVSHVILYTTFVPHLNNFTSVVTLECIRAVE